MASVDAQLAGGRVVIGRDWLDWAERAVVRLEVLGQAIPLHPEEARRIASALLAEANRVDRRPDRDDNS